MSIALEDFEIFTICFLIWDGTVYKLIEKLLILYENLISARKIVIIRTIN